MPALAYPDVVVQLFDDAQASLELLSRVDQTWEAVAGQTPEPGAARHYVRAVEAVSEAVLGGVRSRTTEPLPDESTVVTAASLAPITESGVGAASAVLISVLGALLGVAGLAGAAVSVVEAIRSLRAPLTSGVAEEHTRTLRATPGVVKAIGDALGDTYELPLDAVRRVFQPSSDQELGRWLGVSRTTVADWSSQRFAPSSERKRRLQTVAAIARLIDDYVHPEDVQLYLRDTPLSALGGRTLDDVLSSSPAAAPATLQRALDLLQGALVQ